MNRFNIWNEIPVSKNKKTKLFRKYIKIKEIPKEKENTPTNIIKNT